MSYKATRNRKYTEKLELVDENGKTAEIITVELDADKVAKQLSAKYIELLQAQTDARKISADLSNQDEVTEIYEKVGDAVIDMMEAVFGAEDTKKIRQFYGDSYIDMVQQVMPFVIDVVIPKVRAIAQENRKEVLARYNRKKSR